MARLGYRPELDGVRALAVAAVIGFHAEIPGFAGGAVGVTWFFVLSGFLITTLLLEERDRFGRIDVPKFFLRRALRLLPSLYLLLAVFGVIALVWVRMDWREFASAGLYFTNMHPLVFGRDAAQPFFLHTWSLSLEEQFYLVWPFAIRRLSTPRAAVAVGALVVVAAFVSRFFLGEAYDLLTVPIFSFDGFVIGAFLAVAVRTDRLPLWFLQPPVMTVAAGVMVLDVAVANADPAWLLSFRVLLSELAVAAVIAHLVGRRENRLGQVLGLRPFVYVGLLSYALYLWHFPVFELFTEERAPDLWRPLRHLLKFLVPLVAAMATYHLVDQPVAKLRARARPTTTESVAAPGRRPSSTG